ncbi:MAG: PaaI family thioesterase [Burkholderiaceae bacterium]|nr:PaaI family thioesterase [Burkholderiaceae bacterium]
MANDGSNGDRRLLRDGAAARHALEQALANYSQVPGRFFLASFLGLEVSYPDETCVIEFEAREYLQNPAGALQGGVLATVLDIAMAHLVFHLAGPATTVDLGVQYHRAVRDGSLRCVAGTAHRGKTLWALNAGVWTEDRTLVASGASTVMLTSRRPAG